MVTILNHGIHRVAFAFAFAFAPRNGSVFNERCKFAIRYFLKSLPGSEFLPLWGSGEVGKWGIILLTEPPGFYSHYTG